MMKSYLEAHQPAQDDAWRRARDWCDRYGKDGRPFGPETGHWEALLRATSGCRSHAAFHAALVRHLEEPKGRRESRWKKHPELAMDILREAGAAASDPQLPRGLERYWEFLRDGEDAAVRDRWRLTAARTFLQAVVRIIKTRRQERS